MMDDFTSKLLSMSDQELRNTLEGSEGYDGTPVTPSTRMLLVRKLTRSLLKNSTDSIKLGCCTSEDDCSSKMLEDSSSVNDPNYKSPSDNLNETQMNTKQVYYGVHIPCITYTGNHHPVFSDKKEVFKLMKEFPEARFKIFQTRSEAEEFSKIGTDNSVDFHDVSVASKNDKATNVTLGEKTSSFKGPKPQELVQLRKIIERGEVDKVLETVWKNPRYLVSSGDTPTILQEGSRYNALHIASKTGNAVMCEAILDTVSNPSFVRLLYNGNDESSSGEDKSNLSSASGSKVNDQTVLDCTAYLLDLYLNTPEKGRNETPLHFASKFGKVDAVKVLVSYPVCDRTRPNKLGETPEDLICSRSDHDNKSDAKKISQLIKDRFYVPVMRPLDLSQQASVGEPFSPEKAPLSTPESRKDPKSPMHEINAYAGPMGLEEAWDFCRRWKSPLKTMNGKCPISALSPSHKGLSSPSSCSSSPLRLCDPDRGLEREGRVLANELEIGWMEYWPFLGAFANFSSKDGMKILENYFRQKLHDTYKLRRQSKESINDEDITEVAENLTKENSFNVVDIVPQEMTPITELCEALESCTLSSGKREDDCQRKPSHGYGCTNLVEPVPGASPSPLQYVEKSCRVFGRRISDSLIREAHRGSKKIASNCVGPEVHHLRRLVASFKEESRFSSVDFSHMHSRIASIVADGILESVSSSDADKIMNAMVCIPTTSTYFCSSSDEEDDKYLEKDRDSQAVRREWRITMRHSLHKNEGFGFEEEVDHVKCLMSLIKEALGKAELISSSYRSLEENEHIEAAWAKTKSCPCTWSCAGSLHHYTKASTRTSLAAVCRRLSFDNPPDSEILSDDNLPNIHVDQENQNAIHTGSEIDGNKESSEDEFGTGGNERETDPDEVFYTPPSSPKVFNTQVSSSDDEDELMEDTEETIKIFVEGDHPTKLDLDVLYALEDTGKINPKEFPFIYQWKNLVLTHSAEERARWMSPYAPRWRKQFGVAGSSLNRSSKNAGSTPLVPSNRHHPLSPSPLAQTSHPPLLR